MKFIVCLSTLFFLANARNVVIDVKAPWKRYSTSVIAELAEFISNQSPDLYWTYIDSLCGQSDKVENALLHGSQASGTDIQSFAFEVGSSIVPPTLHPLMDTMLGLGADLPAVRFFESLAEQYKNPCTGSAFMVATPSGAVYCDIESLSAELNTPPEGTLSAPRGGYDWDHVYPNHEEANIPAIAVALYGSIGTTSFCRLHSALSAQAQTGRVQYSARHAFDGASVLAKDTRIQGFGVFLDIKNMEYKTVDDSASSPAAGSASAAATAEQSAFVPGEEVAGIVFATLAERKPALADDLSLLRAELLERAVGEASEMKVWRMKELGMQTLAAVRAAPSPVDKLADIVHNFPMHAPSISSVKVAESIREAVQNFWNQGLHMRLGMNSVYLNGLRISLDGATFNVYDLLSSVREELSSMEKLGSMKLPAPVTAGLKAAAVAVSSSAASENDLSSIVRIDISKGGKHVVTFFNNLEKDPEYKKWPKKLRQLLVPSWQLQALSRNLFTLVTVVDPLSMVGASLLEQMQMLWMQQYPIRFGVVPYCGAPSDNAASAVSASGSQEVSAEGEGSPAALGQHNSNAESPHSRVCRLFVHARETYGPKEASEFLFSVATQYSVFSAESEGAYVPDLITPDVLADIYSTALLNLPSRFESPVAMKKEAMAIQLGATEGKASKKSSKSSAPKSYPFLDFVANTTAYLQARGLPVNSYSLNGIVRVDNDLASSLMQLLGREQYILAQAVRNGLITDKVSSIFSAVLELHPESTYTRYHTMLESTEVDYVDVSLDSAQASLKASHFFSNTDTESNDKLQNTTVLVVSATDSGLTSLASAVQWQLKHAPPGTQRLAFQVVLSPLQERCVDYMSAPRPTALSLYDLTLTDVCAEANIPLLQRVVSLDVLQQYACSNHSCNSLGLRIISESTASLTEKLTFRESFVNSLATEEVTFALAYIQKLTEALEDVPSLARALSRLVGQSRQSFSVATVGMPGAEETLRDFSIVIYNSRRIVMDHSSPSNPPIHELDLVLLSSLEYSRVGRLLDELLQQHSSEAPYTSDNYLQMASFVGLYGGKQGKQRMDVERILAEAGIAITAGPQKVAAKPSRRSKRKAEAVSEDSSPLVLKVQPSVSLEHSSDLSIIYVFDPLSVAGQRAAALLKLIGESLHIPQTVVLTPHFELSEFPLQNFYRYVLSSHYASTLQASKADAGSGADATAATAYFRGLPKQHTLTVRIDGPEPWNIQAQLASQDIDNLRCETGSAVCGDITATGPTDTTVVTYALKNILVTGSCGQTIYGAEHRVPPNGLQLTLSKASSSPSDSVAVSEQSDTLVMQNLGYFQLQANPGLWRLDLAAGRARLLYSFDSSSEDGGEGKLIAVKSFADHSHSLTVAKRPGMENVPLLQDSEDDVDRSSSETSSGSMWDSITSLFGAAPEKPKEKTKPKAIAAAPVEEDNRIHVFSLATGHMYERLLRIMMLSVTKRTSVPVKFWLLENYLSPTFKQMAALMAETYGFEVGYVTYKWPEWLRQQTQKQRIIWGYKILFLDVLFPLNVKKVIYVDADQVLRADLKELWDLDLHGKPYAYTPFCTSRAETLGFQFWRQGYWADHLRGKPYHISALYVVDLQKFRRNAVGDQLRAVYDNLARDPNSLANLDQDLPNYAQHSVPIHSLPQSWLWCETWCSDDSKEEAKTIDLCNNPLHKEPKLDMARRVVSGKLFNESWVQLDEEIRQLEIAGGFRTD